MDVEVGLHGMASRMRKAVYRKGRCVNTIASLAIFHISLSRHCSGMFEAFFIARNGSSMPTADASC